MGSCVHGAAVAAVAAWAFLAAGVPALAQSVTIPPVVTFADPDEPVAARMGQGFTGAARIEDGALMLERQASSTTSILSWSLDEKGKAAVSMDIVPRFDEGKSRYTKGVGLVIRYVETPERKTFYYFIVQGSGKLVAGTYDNGWTGVKSSVDAAAYAKPNGALRLSAVEDGDGVAFHVNDERVARMSARGLEGRRVGLVFKGGGTFRIDNVVMNARGERQPQALPPLDETALAPDPQGGPSTEPAPDPDPADDRPAATPDTRDDQVPLNSEPREETPQEEASPETSGDETPREGAPPPEPSRYDGAATMTGRIMAWEAACPVLRVDWPKGFAVVPEAERPAFLAALAAPRFSHEVERARREEAAKDLAPWQACAELYRATGGNVANRNEIAPAR